MEVIFLRHGTTSGNLERRFIGVTDIPLLPQGEALARQVRPMLPPVEWAYVSPLIRCQQTAALALPDVPKTTVRGLHETDFGPFEEKSHEELKDDPVYMKWLEGGGKEYFLEGTETPDHCRRRIVGAVGYVLQDAQKRGFRSIAVVSHGGALATLMAACGLPPRPYYDWLLPNCSAYRTTVETKPLRIHVHETIIPPDATPLLSPQPGEE